MRLQLEDDMDVIGEVDDGLRVEQAARELQPDVVVMDYEMSGCNGAEAADSLRASNAGTRVVMLSIHDGATVRDAATAAGVVAFVSKHEPSERLVEAIRAAAGLER